MPTLKYHDNGYELAVVLGISVQATLLQEGRTYILCRYILYIYFLYWQHHLTCISGCCFHLRQYNFLADGRHWVLLRCSVALQQIQLRFNCFFISHIMFYLGIKCIIHYHHNVCVCVCACVRACVCVYLPCQSLLFNCCCSNFFLHSVQHFGIYIENEYI